MHRLMSFYFGDSRPPTATDGHPRSAADCRKASGQVRSRKAGFSTTRRRRKVCDEFYMDSSRWTLINERSGDGEGRTYDDGASAHPPQYCTVRYRTALLVVAKCRLCAIRRTGELLRQTTRIQNSTNLTNTARYVCMPTCNVAPRHEQLVVKFITYYTQNIE